jgi:glucosamine kinase
MTNVPAASGSPRHLIGIDGGGTGTRARLAAADGRLLGSGDAGPSGLSQGMARAWTHVELAIARAFADAGLPQAAPAECALGLGLAGAHVPALAAAFCRADPGFALLALDTDAGTTLRGAHGGAPGAIVAAGTGSVGQALFADGRRTLAGGWGFGVGDEGSGAWLGLHAMQQAQRALDGRAPVGALARAVWRVAGGQREALLDWGAEAGQHGYARLAPLVFEAAPSDLAAERLLDRAADELAAIATALDPAGQLPLAVTGSVGARLQDRLPAALRARCVAPAGDSAQGALQLVIAELARRRAAASVRS